MKTLRLFPISLFLIFLFSLKVSAQNNAQITGKIIDETEQAVAFANVVLLSVADSSMVKGAVTDDVGKYRLIGLSAGTYFVSISYVGYSDFTSEKILLSTAENKEIPVIQLDNSAAELQAVTVVGKRPIIEAKPDKMVFNVDGSVNAAGSTALELLRKAPNVVVDNNDNISLAGKSGVEIYIDGKPSPLGAEDLAGYLKSVGSESIDNIEIITNPSAKYDAEGNGGIINIRFKKDKNLGANATLTAGFGQGVGTSTNVGVTANYKTKKTNVFGNYNYAYREPYWFINSLRTQITSEGGSNIFDLKNENRSISHGHNFKTGVDYFINKKSTVGVLVNGFVNDSDKVGESTTTIDFDGDGEIDNLLVADPTSNAAKLNMNMNLNYVFNDGESTTWNVDADYGFFRNEGNEYLPNQYFSADGNTLDFENNYRNKKDVDIDIATFKVDHERPLGKGQLGVGAKTSYVKTDNSFDQFRVQNGEDIFMPEASNDFAYTENVNAIYTSYQQKFGQKWGMQLGLRVEQTYTLGELTSTIPTNNETVDTFYVRPFPSAGISFNPSQNHSYQLNYSRRIRRPDYETLNPFKYLITELSFSAGNPFLRPEFTHSFQVSHTYKYRFTTSFNYSRTTDLMTRVSETEGDQITLLTWLNLNKQDVFNLSFSVPLQITEWWSSYTNVSGMHLRNRNQGDDASRDVNINVNAANVYSQHTFSLPWKLKAELSGFYASPSIWGGVFRTKSMWGIDAGLQRQFFDGNATLRLSMSDLFHTMQWRGADRFAAASSISSGGWDSQRFKVNFSYILGNKQIKSRKRSTGLEDEKKRSSGGDSGGGR